MSVDQDWPYADDIVVRDEFAESLRLPLISTPYPRWCYITAVVVNPESQLPGWAGVRPTDAELCAVASFHQEYIDNWYNEGWKRKMRARPFDLDCVANGRYLIKYPHGGWGYRHATWQGGPDFVPLAREEPQSLLTVLAREHAHSPRWDGWVAHHPEVFEAVR